MKSYIFTIIAVSVLGGIVSSFFGDGNAAIKKRINFVVGMICTIVLLSPIISVVNKATSIKDSITEIINELTVDNSETNKLIISDGTYKIEEGIKETLKNKYKIEENEISVKIVLNKENIEAITVEEIVITLIGKATWKDEAQIKEFIETQTGCKTKIIKR